MSQTTDETPSIPLTPFVVALMEQSVRDREWLTNAVIDGEKRQRVRAQAELALVRDRTCELLDHPWTPSTDAMREALYPSEAEIEEMTERMF